jgi:site-specific DNA-methyltransferase (adenine-specific)
LEEKRRPTSTSNFGVGRRESHDASGFYDRFVPPIVSADDELGVLPELAEPWIHGDSTDMRLPSGQPVPDNSVALVVTSPPYFAGKQYEEELDRDGVPSSYGEYLELLTAVFAECQRVLEPGGRIAVNVANLGRKPYRSLAADVIEILQSLGFLLRGEVIWQKADGAGGNCAWGSFKSATNPVLRDITERVIIASKGRFDRALSVQQRKAEDLPYESTINNDEFLEATLDVWKMPAESAKRVNHPAPFPVALPERLIRLYTFKDDVVLDPFMGSGTTLVAAAKLGRRFLGFDLDPAYVEIARQRVSDELQLRALPDDEPRPQPLTPDDLRFLLARDPAEDFQARASKEGKAAQAIAELVLERAGFTIVERNRRIRTLGLIVNFVAKDASDDESEWYFDVSGAFTTTRGGLLRTDTVWKSLGRASVLARNEQGPLVLLTSDLPKPKSEGDQALHAAGPTAFFDAIEMLSTDGQERLAKYARTGHRHGPIPGFWTPAELERAERQTDAD